MCVSGDPITTSITQQLSTGVVTNPICEKLLSTEEVESGMDRQADGGGTLLKFAMIFFSTSFEAELPQLQLHHSLRVFFLINKQISLWVFTNHNL